jgi:hypothetical protein
MRWKVEATDHFDRWLKTITDSEQEQVFASVDFLEELGPTLGRPYVDTVKGSRYLNLKELRPNQTLRVFFAFDPRRTAVLLIGGDKAGKTKRFYRQMIAKADSIYEAHLRRIKEDGHRDD